MGKTPLNMVNTMAKHAGCYKGKQGISDFSVDFF
jgi:hypothetical protein